MRPKFQSKQSVVINAPLGKVWDFRSRDFPLLLKFKIKGLAIKFNLKRKTARETMNMLNASKKYIENEL
jgi:hypothetical protein